MYASLIQYEFWNIFLIVIWHHNDSISFTFNDEPYIGIVLMKTKFINQIESYLLTIISPVYVGVMLFVDYQVAWFHKRDICQNVKYVKNVKYNIKVCKR